ncbi:MAG: glutathione S-transferase [Caulobacteraceae bacterium]|nr:glutathione S-transferase [Caulobacteraceae bacterium]
MLKVYHSQGARSLRVLWLCEEMGVPYETAEASFFKPSDEFKAINPLRTVPAMQDGDVRMIESVAMMIYIMSKYGPTDLEVKPNEPGYASYLQFLLFGEAGVAAYGNPLVATRFMAPDDQKQNWTAGYLKTAILKRLEFVGTMLGRQTLHRRRSLHRRGHLGLVHRHRRQVRWDRSGHSRIRPRLRRQPLAAPRLPARGGSEVRA